MHLKTLITLTLILFSTGIWAAESDTVSGVVTYVDSNTKTVTIRNDETGRRRTYFVDDSTRIVSNGSPLTLSQIRKANRVNLKFQSTDTGRVVQSLQVPNLNEIVDVIPVEVTEVQTLSGRVTGVRPNQRTITVRVDDTRERRTLTIPETTRITRDGEPLALASIQRGDNITARYRVTDQGWVLVTGRAPVADTQPAVASPAPTALPKTAGHVFAYLLLGLGLFGSSALVRVILRRQS